MEETKKEVIFTDGMFIKRPGENAPDFVKAKLSFKVDTFVAWLQKHKNAEGYVNADILKSAKEGGNLYGKLDDWVKPVDPNAPVFDKDSQGKEINPEDIPF